MARREVNKREVNKNEMNRNEMNRNQKNRSARDSAHGYKRERNYNRAAWDGGCV